MSLEKILTETLDGLWNNSNYGGTSEAPRKDFGPQSGQQGYNFPYQKNAPPIFPPTQPEPENTSNLAAPLQTVTQDLSDSFVYLLAAANKMENCLQFNKALNSKQKKKLKSLMEYATKVLGAIKHIDAQLNFYMELAGPSSPSNPHQQYKKD
jgi:hypothetical protein